MIERAIHVGIGEYVVAASPHILKAVLGSCVGVIIYDKVNRIGGLAHVYLPDSKSYRKRRDEGANGNGVFDRVHKFADVLIPRMLNEIIKKNGYRKYFIAYLVGGASLFQGGGSIFMNVGRKNLEKVRHVLSEENIRFFELHVGGKTGRKVVFNLSNGDIEITEL